MASTDDISDTLSEDNGYNDNEIRDVVEQYFSRRKVFNNEENIPEESNFKIKEVENELENNQTTIILQNDNIYQNENNEMDNDSHISSEFITPNKPADKEFIVPPSTLVLELDCSEDEDNNWKEVITQPLPKEKKENISYVTYDKDEIKENEIKEEY